jgi:hypothetical protein
MFKDGIYHLTKIMPFYLANLEGQNLKNWKKTKCFNSWLFSYKFDDMVFDGFRGPLSQLLEMKQNVIR